MSDNAITVRGLTRTYGNGPGAFTAVDEIDLDVRAGTIHALLGVNGAGKTSAMEVIEGLAAPTSGEVRVLGLDPIADRAEVRRRSGVLLQKSGFIADLSVAETLAMWSSTVTDPRPVAESLEMLHLQDRKDVAIRNLSGGELRRVDLACTLSGRPELVMLDEPTTGLDPESRRAVWDLIAELRRDGGTVLITTHFLDEAQQLADQVSIMQAGRLVREGTIGEIVADEPATIAFTTPARDLPDLAAPVLHADGRTTIRPHDLQETLTRLLTWAAAEDVTLDELAVDSPSLEAVFLRIARGEGANRAGETGTGTARQPGTPTEPGTDTEGALR